MSGKRAKRDPTARVQTSKAPSRSRALVATKPAPETVAKKPAPKNRAPKMHVPETVPTKAVNATIALEGQT